MNEPGALRFFFDYVDPFSLILSRRLQVLEKEGTVKVEPWPLEVNPPPRPLLQLEAPAWAARWEIAMREEEARGLGMEPPWIVPWTRKAHELAFHGREENRFEEIHQGLFRAYLTEGRDIGRVDVLVELARETGLDPLEAKAVLDVDRHRKDVETARARGIREGVEGIPCLLRNGRVLHGNPSPEEIRRFLASNAETV